jgi:hypothetical protein
MATLQASTISNNTLWTDGNYPPTLATFTFSGNYTANTWYTLLQLNSLGHTGIMGVLGYGNTFNMGGGLWDSFLTSPGVYPISSNGPNNNSAFELKASVDAGHAPQGEVWRFRIVQNTSASGLGQQFQWQSNRTYSNANFSQSGRQAQVRLVRLV